jgi:hypothetical protein
VPSLPDLPAVGGAVSARLDALKRRLSALTGRIR